MHLSWPHNVPKHAQYVANRAAFIQQGWSLACSAYWQQQPTACGLRVFKYKPALHFSEPLILSAHDAVVHVEPNLVQQRPTLETISSAMLDPTLACLPWTFRSRSLPSPQKQQARSRQFVIVHSFFIRLLFITSCFESRAKWKRKKKKKSPIERRKKANDMSSVVFLPSLRTPSDTV